MKIKKVLKDLDISFSPYSLLWEQWKNNKYSNFTWQEIYIIDVHRSTNFRFDLDGLVMFYKNTAELQRITAKLNSGYVDFKNWVVASFQFSLVRMVKEGELENFLRMPIEELNISPALKENLKHFKSATLYEVINTYSEEDFKKGVMFDRIIEFINIIAKQEKL